MLSINIKCRCYLIVLCLALIPIVLADPSQGTLLDKVIANVDNQIILQSELETAYQQYLLQGGQEDPDLKCKILESMIFDKILLVKATQEGIVVTGDDVAQELSERMQQLVTQVGSEVGLVQYYGKPIEEIKNKLREEIKKKTMLNKMRFQLTEDIVVTPQEVKEFFEALPAQERKSYHPIEVAVRQIVRYPQVSQQEKDTLIAQLKALKVRLQNGENFGALAQEYSQDSGSAPQGGDLGFWRLGELAPAYEAAALALQPGEVSDPVTTQSGFHLIQLIARDKDRYNSRHILLKPNPAVLDIEAAKTQLAQLRAAILAGKVTFEQAAKRYSEDLSTASMGGLLTGEHGGTRMLIDVLPPDVYFAIDQLTPGAISDPMLFTAADGQEAIRILLLEEKIAPHEVNLAQDYEKIQQMVIYQKKNAELQKWFEGVKTSVSINVAPEYQNCMLLR